MFGEPGFTIPYSWFLISDSLFQNSDCRFWTSELTRWGNNMLGKLSFSDFRFPISSFRFCITQFEVLRPGEPGLFISASYFPWCFSSFTGTISTFESQITNFWVNMLGKAQLQRPGGTLGWRAGGTLPGGTQHQPFKKMVSKNPLGQPS